MLVLQYGLIIHLGNLYCNFMCSSSELVCSGFFLLLLCCLGFLLFVFLVFFKSLRRENGKDKDVYAYYEAKWCKTPNPVDTQAG